MSRDAIAKKEIRDSQFEAFSNSVFAQSLFAIHSRRVFSCLASLISDNGSLVVPKPNVITNVDFSFIVAHSALPFLRAHT